MADNDMASMEELYQAAKQMQTHLAMSRTVQDRLSTSTAKFQELFRRANLVQLLPVLQERAPAAVAPLEPTRLQQTSRTQADSDDDQLWEDVEVLPDEDLAAAAATPSVESWLNKVSTKRKRSKLVRKGQGKGNIKNKGKGKDEVAPWRVASGSIACSLNEIHRLHLHIST